MKRKKKKFSALNLAAMKRKERNTTCWRGLHASADLGSTTIVLYASGANVCSSCLGPMSPMPDVSYLSEVVLFSDSICFVLWICYCHDFSLSHWHSW